MFSISTVYYMLQKRQPKHVIIFFFLEHTGELCIFVLRGKTCNNNEKQKQLNIMTFILELLLMQQILRIINIKVQEITINHKINRYYVLREGQHVDYPLIAHLIVHRA